MRNFKNYKSSVSVNDALIYMVTGLVTELDSGFIDLLRWMFGIDMYSSIKVLENQYEKFQFSNTYSYSVFTPLIDGCLDMNLRFFILFNIFTDLITFDVESIDDFELQIQIAFQSFLADINSIVDFLYFVGIGANLIILYDDLNYFIQFMIQTNFGSNAWLIVLLVRNLSFFPFLVF